MKTAAIIERLSRNDEMMRDFYQNLYKKISKINSTGDKSKDKDLMMREMYKQPVTSVEGLIKAENKKAVNDRKDVENVIVELISQNRLKRETLVAKEVLNDSRIAASK